MLWVFLTLCITQPGESTLKWAERARIVAPTLEPDPAHTGVGSVQKMRCILCPHRAA